jgi:L-iditol 2-dehydrogenase
VKAIELVAKGRVQTTEKVPPKIGRNDILIKTAYTGICGSDIHAFNGMHPFRKPPVVLGHEISGIVHEVGSDVVTCKKGDRVTVLPAVPCGTCEACREGKENICTNKAVPGTNSWLGTFSEYFLTDQSTVFVLESNVSLKSGVLAEPLAVSVHASEIANVTRSSKVLVLGAGTIGLFTGIAAAYRHAKELVFTDVMDSNLARAEQICRCKTYNVGKPEIRETLNLEFEKYFDVVFVCNNSKDSLNDAIKMTKGGGTVVVIGMYTTPPEVNILEVTLHEIRIIGSQIYTKRDFNETLSLLGSNIVDVNNIISHVFSPDDAQKAFDLINNRSEPIVKVVFKY